jgi:ABC-type glycerol-3-phosphate transport system substrate-binding protein
MAAQKVTKVTFWHPYGTPVEEKAIKKSTDLFNRQNPNIQVKAVFAGSSGD